MTPDTQSVDISDALLQDKRVDTLAKKRDVEGLIDLLEHGDGQLPAIAAYQLGLLGDARAVEPLLRRFRRINFSTETEDEEYEWVCLARALGRLTNAGSPASDELLEALERLDRRGFRMAALALADTGDRRAIEPLVHLLGSIDTSSLTPEDERDAEYAIDALGMLKAPEAVDALIAALEIESLREGTAEALGDIGDPRAVAPLAALLEPEPPFWVGNAIWNALNQIGTPEAKAAVDAWEERHETPPDAGEWKAERIPPAVVHPLRRWWYKPWWWPAWLSWQRKYRREEEREALEAWVRAENERLRR